MVDKLKDLFILIKRFEGCKLIPYICPAGVWTCGWGSTGYNVIPGQKWTQEYADQRLENDAIRFAVKTLSLCPVLANESDERLSAISDFTYNLGSGRLKASTLRKKINMKNWEASAKELRKWIWGGGRKLPGLILRREAEIKLLS